MSSIFNLFGYNNSVLSGAMDMIVIKQEDNTFKSTPLMVRFGQFRILKAKETNVEIYINDNKIDLPMRLSEQGEAYILKERKTVKEKLNIILDSPVTKNISDASISDDFVYVPGADKGLSLSLSPRNTNNNFEDDIDDNNNIDMKEVINTTNSAFNVKRRESIKKVKNKTTLKHKRKMSFDLFLYSGTTRSKVIKNNKLIISKETSFQIDAISNKIINNNFSISNNIKIELSNSWNTISKNKDDSKFDIQKIFTESQYTKEEFFKDPWKIINNTNLAIKHGKHIYTWKVIAPLLISYLAYGESLPEQTLNSLTAQQNGFLMWKTIENNAYKIELTTKNIINDDNSNTNTNTSTTSETNASSNRSKHSQNTKKRKYKKSYYFTSEHLSQMNLNYGKNTVQFKIKTPYYGTHVLVADIYLWNYNDKIIISDYDGTITRTDVIGMFFGWTHKKVALLYNNLDRNGYKIIYLTARPVCTHERTKNTLFSLTQDSLKMPKGPVLMSPDGFFISLKKEVIDRTPQEFKIECLTNVLNLFSGTQPFYAGIGNKQSDVYAYEAVGVPRDKIFIINEKGEVRTPANKFHLTTFKQIHEEIDLMFPDVKGGNTYFYDVDYYKPKLDDKEVDVDEWFK